MRGRKPLIIVNNKVSTKRIKKESPNEGTETNKWIDSYDDIGSADKKRIPE